MDNRILQDLRAALFSRRSLEDLPEDVWKRASALNTWGTNAIEGNTLTWEDVEKLLLEDTSVGGRPVSDVLETLQHEQAFRSLVKRKATPITLVTVLELHEAVFKGIRGKDPGLWRRVNVRIRGTPFRPPSMEKVVPQMEAWLADYDRRAVGGEDAFGLAAWMHHRFEAIHPFSDGNGRAGRLLLNLHFMRHNWPPVHLGPADRNSYLRALETGNKGELEPLRVLLQGAMGASLLDLLEQVGTERDRLIKLATLAHGSGHDGHYLALRANQGVLPAVKQGGRWVSSRRALELYQLHVGRD